MFHCYRAEGRAWNLHLWLLLSPALLVLFSFLEGEASKILVGHIAKPLPDGNNIQLPAKSPICWLSPQWLNPTCQCSNPNFWWLSHSVWWFYHLKSNCLVAKSHFSWLNHVKSYKIQLAYGQIPCFFRCTRFFLCQRCPARAGLPPQWLPCDPRGVTGGHPEGSRAAVGRSLGRDQWSGWRENRTQKPWILLWNMGGVPVKFPFNQSIEMKYWVN